MVVSSRTLREGACMIPTEGQSALDWQRGLAFQSQRFNSKTLKRVQNRLLYNINFTDMNNKLYFFKYECDMVKYRIYFTSLCMKICSLPEVLMVLICASRSFWVMIVFIADLWMRSDASNFLIWVGVIKHGADLFAPKPNWTSKVWYWVVKDSISLVMSLLA